jgi:hypothetical protein
MGDPTQGRLAEAADVPETVEMPVLEPAVAEAPSAAG